MTTKKDVSKDISLGLWGTSRSGKTTFMAMLYFAFLQHPDWDIRAMDDVSQEFVESVREALYNDGRFHRKTVDKKQYTFRIESKRSADRSLAATLKVSDLPGELFEDFYQRDKRQSPVVVHQSSVSDQTTLTPKKAFDDLAAVDGLLILLDPGWVAPEAEHRSYHQLLFQLFQELRTQRGESAEMPLTALCLMKSDAKLTYWKLAQNFDGEGCKYRGQSIFPLQCETDCPIHQIVQPPFISQQIYGLIPKDRVRCFLMSAVGRAASDQLNVGDNNLWKRNLTPSPPLPFATTAADAALINEMASRPGQPSSAPLYYPTTITNTTQLQPVGLIQPIEWFVKTLKSNL